MAESDPASTCRRLADFYRGLSARMACEGEAGGVANARWGTRFSRIAADGGRFAGGLGSTENPGVGR